MKLPLTHCATTAANICPPPCLPFRRVAFVRVLYVPFIRWRFVCRLFISTVFALARIIFCTCRPRRHQQGVFFRLFALFLSFFLPFTSVQRSSFVYVVLSLTRRSPSLLSLCGRCLRSINFRWFVFCTCCVCVCENVLVCVWAMYFFVYTIFFVGRRAATLTLASCFLGPPVEWFFLL